MVTTPSRVERDALGEKSVPLEAYYGIQTVRALENFPVSGLGPHPALVTSTVLVKKCAAQANRAIGRLPAEVADAIIAAADEVLEGQLRDQFVVDVYQAGAGTSHNMNVNEVLANRAEELLGGRRGSYSRVHPNDHVNMSQSTNDGDPAGAARGDGRPGRRGARPVRRAGDEGIGLRARDEGGPHAPAGCRADD